MKKAERPDQERSALENRTYRNRAYLLAALNPFVVSLKSRLI
jgi:hypothetical protein